MGWEVKDSYGNNKANEAKPVMNLQDQVKAWQLPVRFSHALILKTLE